jgi:hypothetical protein
MFGVLTVKRSTRCVQHRISNETMQAQSLDEEGSTENTIEWGMRRGNGIVSPPKWDGAKIRRETSFERARALGSSRCRIGPVEAGARPRAVAERALFGEFPL